MNKEILYALQRRDERIDYLETKLSSLERYLNIEYHGKSPEEWRYPKYVKRNIATVGNDGFCKIIQTDGGVA